MPIKDVFIIMPFEQQELVQPEGTRTYSKQHLDDVYTLLCDAVHEHRNDISVGRMEQAYGNLVSAIIRRLSSTDVVLAVLAGRNPNVFYELGVRHALRLNTVMLIEEFDEYPFDLKGYFSYRYSIDSEPQRRKLKEFVRSRLQEIDASGSLPDSPVIDVLDLSEFEQLRVINSWETRRAALVLHGLLREVAGVTNAFSECLDDIRAIAKPKENRNAKKLTVRHLRLSWDVIDGFTKGRTVPGMPCAAYTNAEEIYARWRTFESEWNRLADDAAGPERLQNVVAATDRYTLAFAHDLVSAWEYVRSRRLAAKIPWGSSMDRASKLIPDFPTLNAVRQVILRKAREMLQTFPDFDAAFSGIPDSILGRTATDAGGGEEASDFSRVVQQASASDGKLTTKHAAKSRRPTAARGATSGTDKVKRKRNKSTKGDR